MMTVPDIRKTVPTPTPRVAQSLPPDQLKKHRTQISFEVKAFLKASYFDEKLAPEIEAAILSDWCDELQDWGVDQIRWALRERRRIEPDRKPNPAHILAILLERRGRAAADRIKAEMEARLAAQHEAPRPRVDEETRKAQQAEIQRMIGGLGKNHGKGETE